MEENQNVPDMRRLQHLLVAGQHDVFLEAFENAPNRLDDFLQALGGEGLCLLLEGNGDPLQEWASRYGDLLLQRSIVAPPEAIFRLSSLLHSYALAELARHNENQNSAVRVASAARRIDDPHLGDKKQTILKVRRVVQVIQLFLGDGRFSDATGVCRSVFRSQQERTFLRALSLRFPGLMALPNYPLDQIIALDRIGLLDAKTLRYGRNCRLDAVLIVPDEGDPVAVFELDSRIHDQREIADRDRMKNVLMAATGLPFFRLRAESPDSMSIDEWYALLSDQVLPYLDLGDRIRCRKAAYNLIPC